MSQMTLIAVVVSLQYDEQTPDRPSKYVCVCTMYIALASQKKKGIKGKRDKSMEMKKL